MDPVNIPAEETEALCAFSETSFQSINHALKRIMRSPSFLLIRLLYLAFLIIGIVFLIQSLNPWETGRFLFALALILLAIGMYIHRFLIYPSKQAKAVMQSRSEDPAAVLLTRCRFLEEGILSQPKDGREESLIEYDDVRKLMKDDSYWILETNQKKLLVLPVSSFDEHRLESFLLAKCPSLYKSEKKQR